MPTNNSDTLVLLGNQSGWTLIPKNTPLTRLNYFDGKFLRAADLKAEQEYVRRLVHMSNEAGGPGVARGFDLKLEGGGDTLHVGSGLAIDPKGRVLLLTMTAPVNIQQLIEQSKSQGLVSSSAAKSSGGNGGGFNDCETVSLTPQTTALLPSDLYLITIGHAEGYCGEEPVFGKLCEEACTTGTDRPYVVEGLVLRATPLHLTTLPATSKAVALMQKHRRSLVASAYFEDERNLVASLISGAGLKSDIWCYGAEGASGTEVPLGVIARAGNATLFMDAWTARRERIDPPAKRYWQWRMRMRPWDVFLAQILQFQCQLSDLFQSAPPPGGTNPCDDAHKLVAEASEALAELTKIYEAISGRLYQSNYGRDYGFAPYTGGAAGLNTLHQKLQAAKAAHLLTPTNRLLINGGIVELPSAGYLPVAPSETLSVNEQVALMMGEGVDLRFCVVRPDYVAHALESAQHMERISLLEGLDDPKKKPEVDILVPDGLVIEEKQAALGGYEAELDVLPFVVDGIINTILEEVQYRALGYSYQQRYVPIKIDATATFTGAARSEVLPGDGRAFRAALVYEKQAPPSYYGTFKFNDSPITIPQDATVPKPAPAATAKSMKAEEGASAAAGKQTAAAGKQTAETHEATQADAQKKRLFKRMAKAAVKMGWNRAPMNVPAGGGGAAEAPAGGAKAATPGVVAKAATPAAATPAAATPAVATYPTQQASLLRYLPVAVEAGMWLTVSCDKDPAKLKAGQTLKVEGRYVAAGATSSHQTKYYSDDLSAYLDVRLSADVLVTEATTVSGRHHIKCQVSAFGAAITKLFDKDTDAGTVNLDAEVSWGAVTGGQDVEVKVYVPDDDGGMDGVLSFKARWGKEPREVEANLEMLSEGYGETRAPKEVKLDFLNTRFRSNPDVNKPGNENHEQAQKALQVVGSALKDPSFYGASSALLFPPPPEAEPGLVVRGTRDWVLFHRRRTKKCGEMEPVVAAAERLYRVYQILLLHTGEIGHNMPKNPLTKEEILKVLPQNMERIRKVGEVKFGGGVATILGNTTALKAGWKGGPTNTILWGGIASHDDALDDGSALAQSRGKAVASLLGTLSKTARMDVLPIVPPWLDSTGVDGVILLMNIEKTLPSYYAKAEVMKAIGDRNLDV